MRKKFYLWQRENGIYYVQFIDPDTGVALNAKSTRCKNEDDAKFVIRKWLEDGIPGNKKKTRVFTYR
ncbi:hypothetical protein FACS1894139_06010 [Planctomycetales bacterium]|nr:hypothetical protein FACS1894107_00360 [Planctomycetales bacterium]GHS96207.1 hypothetical protein FACS1894108_00430 [Planctomycetales bacterium]GHT04231.1 hypothetical protein FACS1894139_06010 [Planctomycetales bacterium]GHV23994.1 hypothetical protein AGMMS49959_19060 [Planctomycetales bacterium]